METIQLSGSMLQRHDQKSPHKQPLAHSNALLKQTQVLEYRISSDTDTEFPGILLHMKGKYPL